jgi:hypothetical protein
MSDRTIFRVYLAIVGVIVLGVIVMVLEATVIGSLPVLR